MNRCIPLLFLGLLCLSSPLFSYVIEDRSFIEASGDLEPLGILHTLSVGPRLSHAMTHTREQLQKECSRALQCYIRIIKEGCDLLGQVKEGAIPENKRDKIFSHRKQELLAYAAYTRAQRRLWNFLSNSERQLASYMPKKG